MVFGKHIKRTLCWKIRPVGWGCGSKNTVDGGGGRNIIGDGRSKKREWSGRN